MKFFAEPNFFVKISSKTLQRLTNLKGLRFDENGEYVTDNQHVIKAMKNQFKYEEELIEEIIEENKEEVKEEIKEEEKPKRGRK